MQTAFVTTTRTKEMEAGKTIAQVAAIVNAAVRTTASLEVTSGVGIANVWRKKTVVDPRLVEEWSGRAGVREVSADDPDLVMAFPICRRPSGVATAAKGVRLKVNRFAVSLTAAPSEIFKYHLSVERAAIEGEGTATSSDQPQGSVRCLVRFCAA